jgi:RNA polymerase sigma factor (sigma-70 family)
MNIKNRPHKTFCMGADKCKQILKVENLLRSFGENLKEQSDDIISCLYTCYYDSFIKWAIIVYDKYPEDFIIDISDRAFTDGIFKLQQFTIKKGLYEGKAGVNAIFFRFFKNQLKANLKKESRLAERNLNLPKNFPGEFQAGTNDDLKGLSDIKEEECLKQSLSQMKEDDRQIIIWRHVDEMCNKEIAKRLGITTPSATNRIYRCMEQLRNLMEKCKHDTHGSNA